jgi:hypothetical protein
MSIQCVEGRRGREFESRSYVLVLQLYEIKLVSVLRQVIDFLRITRFPPPIQRTTTIFLSPLSMQHKGVKAKTWNENNVSEIHIQLFQ